MKVNVEFVGAVRRPWPEQQREVEVGDGSTVGDLLGELGYERKEQRYLTTLLEDQRVKPSRELSDGDHLVVMLVIGGG